MSDLEHDDWNRRYEASLQQEREAARVDPVERRDLLFHVLGSGLLFGLLGLFGGPLGHWRSPTTLQRLGNVGILFAVGAALGFRLLISRRDD